MSAKDIELLKDDKHYYGELGRKYLSNSDVGALLHNPKKFKQSGEETKAMIEGRYFHTAMLEPEKLGNFEFIDVSSRNTKAYKELDRLVLLQKEKEWLDELISTMKSNLHFTTSYIMRETNMRFPVLQRLEVSCGKERQTCSRVSIS